MSVEWFSLSGLIPDGGFLNGIALDFADSRIWVMLGGISALTFVLSILLVPVIIARIPTDYFTQAYRKRNHWRQRDNPALSLCWRLLKNMIGLVLLLMGIAMLVLPGQGLLTILFALSLLDFPGRFRLEKRLVAIPNVFRTINWIRQRANRPPIIRD